MKAGWIAVTFIACTLVPGLSSAELKTVGEGKQQKLVRSQFPGKNAEQYDIFAKKCTKCHAEARPIAALQSGKTPISRGDFDREGIKEYVVKMMRKPNSGIDREQAKDIIEFLEYARSLAKTK